MGSSPARAGAYRDQSSCYLSVVDLTLSVLSVGWWHPSFGAEQREFESHRTDHFAVKIKPRVTPTYIGDV